MKVNDLKRIEGQDLKLIPGPGALKDPTALVGIFIGGELTEKELRKIQDAKEYATKMTVQYMVKKQEQAERLRRAKQQQRVQAYHLMCKLYVGNIPFEARDIDLRPIFEPFGHIARLDLNIDPALGRHRGFAFVEYDCPDAAYMAARERNSHPFSGRPLKVKVRPEDHAQSLPIVEEMIAEARSTYYRAYIANVKPNIPENDIKEVLKSFGAISCMMVRDPRSAYHKGYGYVDFEDSHSVITAASQMNHFDLVGNLLYIQHSVVPPGIMSQTKEESLPAASKLAALKASSMIQAGLAVANNVAPIMARPQMVLPPPGVVTIQAPQIVLPPPRIAPALQAPRVVRLTNMLSPEDVDDDLEDEIQEECVKYGRVVRTKVVIPPPPSDQVEIYVEFSAEAEARAAVVGLNGRFFAGKVIQATAVATLG